MLSGRRGAKCDLPVPRGFHAGTFVRSIDHESAAAKIRAAGLPELRQAIADKTARDSNFRVKATQVLVTNGGKQAVYQQRRDYLVNESVPLIIAGKEVGRIGVMDLLP